MGLNRRKFTREFKDAAEAAAINYPQFVYPYLEKQMNLSIPIPLIDLCRLA